MIFNVLKTVFSPVIGVAFGLALFGAASAAIAEEEKLDCDNAQYQIEINMCAAKRYETIDKELNVLYQKAVKKIQKENSLRLEGFRNTQRMWIKFRDVNCEYARSEYEGGSMSHYIYSSCMSNLTKQRIENIKFLIGD